MTPNEKSQVELAASLMAAMKNQGISAEELSEKSGVPVDEIQKILAGEIDLGPIFQMQEIMDYQLVLGTFQRVYFVDKA